MASWADGSAADFKDFLNHACHCAFGEVYRYSPAVRIVRDAVNPMEFYDEDFLFRFRFTKASVIAIMSELQLKKNTDRRGTPLPPLLKVLITLRFYNTGAMQTVVGDLVRVSQQYVSRCVWEITQVICLRLFPKYVRLPDAADANAVMARFYAIGLFPGVTGCIDCTHVPIVSPGDENAEVFRNRKGYFSLNVPAITGPELQFFDVVASWPGSVHDSRIFTNSRVMALYEQKAVLGVLLGDQGRSVATWAQQEVPRYFVSDTTWKTQRHFRRDLPLDCVPWPFRGCTLADIEKAAGGAQLPTDAAVEFCATCRVTVHYQCYYKGALHVERTKAPAEGMATTRKASKPAPLSQRSDTDLAALCRQQMGEDPHFAALLSGLPPPATSKEPPMGGVATMDVDRFGLNKTSHSVFRTRLTTLAILCASNAGKSQQ
ncbi:hypothetical protein HPB51_010605 [Rhipicephalus microplus]|uniref:DDE Tnp4 domain-containing protein n=1 Tax=Rhipicephalus microplus TaxID=6941 RepID=A0A9J6ENW9_RHIMP|nr:hypothetical protein HPB51_010605 [Rhipicephalus microplus]